MKEFCTHFYISFFIKSQAEKNTNLNAVVGKPNHSTKPPPNIAPATFYAILYGHYTAITQHKKAETPLFAGLYTFIRILR